MTTTTINIGGYTATRTEGDDGAFAIVLPLTFIDVIYIHYKIHESDDAATRHLEVLEHLRRVMAKPLKQLRDEHFNSLQDRGMK